MDFGKIIDGYKDSIVKSTQDIIKIRSVEAKAKKDMPFGEGPKKALDHVLNLSEELGMTVKNFDNYAGHAEFGQGEEVVGVLAHVDVVPEGDGWTYPPYAAEIHDDKIFGRGTLDDKGPAIAALYAMKALKDSGVELKRKVRIIFGTNEETGWGGINYYFQHEEPPTMAFTPDANFPVIYGEKGIIDFDLVKDLDSFGCCGIRVKDIKGGNAPNMVPDGATATLEVDDIKDFKDKFHAYREKKGYPVTMDIDGNSVKLTAKGISAHGSTPEKGENAISYLMDFLGEIMGGECDMCDFISIYNERIKFQHHGKSIGCGFEDEESGKLSFNPGIIKIKDSKIFLTINVRYPIESNARQVYDGIKENLKDTKIELIEGKKDNKPLYVPKDNFLVKKLMEVYREQTGEMHSEPVTIGGGTYARAMDNAVAFGPMFPGQKELAHQKDEFISIDHLMEITKIYAYALYELAK